ncbi:glycosyltransferase family 4 protein [Patulibacter sp. SYSU D01012]|uniref:glycosyltransferase family 4 protein n=1 Tax=Patulibacter sp. SYSU D01012 TaxID=2817381 RepID=UPI001B310965|nr:glycosyltransferase family 4 protein [Patulibacter sp. SYSU D01012]
MPRTRRRDVAFFAPWAGPNLTAAGMPSGGAEVQMLHLARGLARRGTPVALVTYAVPGLPTDVDGVEVVPLRRSRRGRPGLRRLITLGSTVHALGALRARVVVQRSAGSTTGIVGVAARLTRTRFVYSSASTVDFSLGDLGHGRGARLLFALGVRLAHEIVVQTDEQAALCRERFGRRATVIRSVAERPAVEPGPYDEGFLWIGRLPAYKNPLACVALARAVPEAPFTMVCVPSADDPPGLRHELEEAAAALPNLRVLGPQPRPSLLERMGRATAIVSTSDFEGMPNTLLEGWSRGVPAATLAHDPDGVIERERLGTCAHGAVDRMAEQLRVAWATRAGDEASRTRARCRDYVRREHDPAVVVGRWSSVLAPRTRRR